MKRILLTIAFGMVGILQGMDSTGLLQEKQFTIMGSDDAFINISFSVARSIPQFNTMIQDDFSSTCMNVSQSDLTFVASYAFLRQRLKINPIEKQEKMLEEDIIKGMDLPVLAHRTVLISNLYYDETLPENERELFPQGFDIAWSYYLNDCRVGRGDVDNLITNEKLVDLIFLLQDQEALRQSSIPLKDSDLPEFMFLNQKIDQDKKDSETENDKPSVSKFAAFKSAISQRWSAISSFHKLVMGGGFSAFTLICLYLKYRK